MDFKFWLLEQESKAVLEEGPVALAKWWAGKIFKMLNPSSYPNLIKELGRFVSGQYGKGEDFDRHAFVSNLVAVSGMTGIGTLLMGLPGAVLGGLAVYLFQKIRSNLAGDGVDDIERLLLKGRI